MQMIHKNDKIPFKEKGLLCNFYLNIFISSFSKQENRFLFYKNVSLENHLRVVFVRIKNQNSSLNSFLIFKIRL